MDKNTKDLIIYVGAGAALYFALIRPLLQKLGIQKTSEEIKQQKTIQQGRTAFIENALKKVKPTRPEGQFAIFADQVYEFLRYSGLSDQKDKAFNILFTFIHNDADIALLTKYFGQRQEFNFGLPVGGKKNLSEFVASNLSKNQIARINQAYAKSKMSFRF